MDAATRNCLLSYLEEIRDRCNAEQLRLEQMKDYASKRLKIMHYKDGREYYCIYSQDQKRFIYVGSGQNEEVLKIKEAHFHKLMASELSREIRITENFLQLSKCIDYASIDNIQKKAYKGAAVRSMIHTSKSACEWKETMEQYKRTIDLFRPEELIHKTRDGSFVRSKGEALIYNYLLEAGITFVYELPLRIRYDGKRSLLLPDFTVLCETDNKSIIFIEHQGMMNDPRYRNKFIESVYKYWSNDYLPERDVFFTFDLPNGGFDDTAVKSIIRRFVRTV